MNADEIKKIHKKAAINDVIENKNFLHDDAKMKSENESPPHKKGIKIVKYDS